MIGETISHYHILERLGTGGMGDVYKAEDTRLNRYVAIKMLKTFLLGTDEQSETARLRFLREAQAASAINHPNIATIYEIDEVEHAGARYSFIAMEYVPGQTLKALRGQLELNEWLDVFIQIADGLAEAHERGIVHRDLKPSNILLTENNRAKVLDFGVAKFNPLAQGDASEDPTASLYHTSLLKTQPGTVLGTFAYMSPEQALGEEVDRRSDIFSLGIVYYELLAGVLPFTGSSALAVVDAILHASPAPLSTFNSDVSPALEDVIHRMIAKDRALRYQSLREVTFDLDSLKHGVTAVLGAETYRSAPVPLPGEDSYATYIGGNLLDSAALKARSGKSIAVLRFNNITGSPEDEWIGVGIAETVTADMKNIEGVAVIGRELIYEVLRRWNADKQPDFDEKFATRVGREVGARWIIGGGYQRFGEMLRITARFVEVETGELIKTVKIDGRLHEIFELQDKIVYELSRDLDLSLRIGERAGIEARETDVLEAYEAYIRARALAYSGAPEAIETAIELTHKAIELDPHYAQAYAGLAYVLTIKGQYLGQLDLIEQAIEYAQKAIELRPNLAESYSAIGFAFIALDRIADAIGALKRALAFAPNDSFVRASLGRAYFIGKGWFREAAAEYERALQDSSENSWVVPSLAHVYTYLGEYARAEELSRQAVEAQESYQYNHEGVQIIGAYARLGFTYYLQGRYDEALAEYQRELAFLEHTNHALKERTQIEVQQKLAAVYVRLGELTKAREAFESMLTAFQARLQQGLDDPFTRYYIACGCAMLGETELALEHLQKAIEGRRTFNTARARIEADFESLRAEPRFQALLQPTTS
ncbi:MAG: protein kinase [Acidobacteria bacterium]|nr:protein kinase [Acidobacteriota bacterium]MBI3427710.1 protein kinase [Acidobacteriota bacterium]